MEKKLTKLAAEAIDEASTKSDPLKKIEELRQYLQNHPIVPENMRTSDYPTDAHINDMSIEDLEELIKAEGDYFIDDNDNLCILASYSRLVKLRVLQNELIKQGKDCADCETDWFPKD